MQNTPPAVGGDRIKTSRGTSGARKASQFSAQSAKRFAGINSGKTFVYSTQAAERGFVVQVSLVFGKQDLEMCNPSLFESRIITIATVPNVVKDPRSRGGFS